jgi:hypothetical protein
MGTYLKKNNLNLIKGYLVEDQIISPPQQNFGFMENSLEIAQRDLQATKSSRGLIATTIFSRAISQVAARRDWLHR